MGNNYRLYEDSVLVSEHAISKDISIEPLMFSLGASTGTDNKLRTSYLANVNIYNEVLTKYQIRKLYSELSPVPDIELSTNTILCVRGTPAQQTLQTKPSGCAFSLGGTLPEHVTFNPQTGAFSYTGENTEPGTYSVTVSASKAGYTTVSKSIDVVVLAEVIPPTDGLVFYAPLSAITPKSEATEDTWNDDPAYLDGYPLSYLKRTGNSSSESSDPTEATVDVIPCLYFDSSHYLSVPDLFWKNWDHDQTFSWWVNFSESNVERGMIGDCAPGRYTDNFRMAVLPDNKLEAILYSLTGGKMTSTSVLDTNNWHHIVVMISDNATTVKLYIDGVLEDTAACTGSSTNNDAFCIGRARDLTRGDVGCRGYMAGVRIYNKALSQVELLILQHEYT